MEFIALFYLSQELFLTFIPQSLRLLVHNSPIKDYVDAIPLDPVDCFCLGVFERPIHF